VIISMVAKPPGGLSIESCLCSVAFLGNFISFRCIPIPQAVPRRGPYRNPYRFVASIVEFVIYRALPSHGRGRSCGESHLGWT
jgi:hypothetical protein